MVIRLRTAFLIVLCTLILLFLYSQKEILTPFIFAGIFAYIFNPVVNFFSHKIRLPRTLSVLIIYFSIVSIFIVAGVIFARRIVEESSDFKAYMDTILITTKHEVSFFPDWLRPTINETLISLDKITIFNTSSIFEIFPKAISKILGFFIFIFAGFYFLKEGRLLINKFLNYVPQEYRIDSEIILRKINQILNGYLRGQIFLVFLVSVVLFIALLLMGVKFALLIAVFSGIAEIVPIIGPIVAATMAAVIVLITGSASFGLNPTQTAIIVIGIYFIVRQIQDFFVTPQVMGRITKLHPVIILFSVLVGEHSFGILGLILAVPTAAVIKLLLDFTFDKINRREAALKK